ncbi:MAG: rRNA processing protein RimM [Chitinophagaceae bacterium]|nr:rRNA processing protein RimM [Chitinophagaceae bacterium]
MPDYIHIGKIVASFGLKGEIILKHSLGKKTDLKKTQVLFVEELKGSHLPFFIESSKAKDTEEISVKLEGINSKEATRKILAKNAWLTVEDFNLLADKNAPIGLIGFSIFNEDELIGIIEEVIEQPHQVLLRINYKEKEAYIPVHAETLDKIDRKKKEVHVTLPDGLLDIYE